MQINAQLGTCFDLPSVRWFLERIENALAFFTSIRLRRCLKMGNVNGKEPQNSVLNSLKRLIWNHNKFPDAFKKSVLSKSSLFPFLSYNVSRIFYQRDWDKKKSIHLFDLINGEFTKYHLEFNFAI